mmetsp:Transcript_18349/g.28739  ORF Transcript_18349/g.28739 Transcript_18349/m.28739 type:complete len:281 (+) Transcript_18349:703-1545(+)
MLRIGGRVSIESVGVNLENSRTLAASDVVYNGLSSLSHVGSVLSINHQTWDTVVLSLLVNFAVGSDIASESVNSTSIINDDEEKGEIVFRRRVKKFCRTSVLGTTFTHEHDGDSVIIGGWGHILLFETLIIRQCQFAIQQNAFGSTSSIGELLRNERPSALEISGLVKNVHGSAGALTASRFLHEEFGHDLTWRYATGNSMGVLSVVGVFLIPVLDCVVHEGWDRFLSVIQMHEPSNFSLHVLLVAGVFESSCQLKGFVDFHECFFIIVYISSVLVNLSL